MKLYIDIALIIVSIALITSVILQSKGAGLGGLTGMDTGGIFAARQRFGENPVPHHHRPERNIFLAGHTFGDCQYLLRKIILESVSE